MKKIVVEERNGKYVVHLATDESIWGYGDSKQEAIGEMIVTCRKRLDIVIEYKEG